MIPPLAKGSGIWYWPRAIGHEHSRPEGLSMPASIKHYDTSQLNQFFRATTWNYHWIWVKVSDPCIPFTFRQKHFLTLRFANGKKGEREDYQGVISAPKLTRPHPMREGGNCFWAWGEAVIGWRRRRGGRAWKLIGDLVPCGGKIWKELLFNVKSCQQSRIQNRLFFHFSLSFPFRVRIRQRILHSSSFAHFLSKSNCRLLCKCQSKPPPRLFPATGTGCFTRSLQISNKS